MSVYKLSAKALLDIEEIWLYTAQTWSDSRAESYVDGLFSCFATIVDDPFEILGIDHVFPGYKRRSYRSHVIFYRYLRDNQINIVRVLHKSRDFSRHLSDF